MKRKRQAAQVTIAAAGLTALWASIGAVGLALCLLVAAVLWLQVYAESGIGG